MKYFCPKCGAANAYINGAKPKFCGNCGCKFEDAGISNILEKASKPKISERTSFYEEETPEIDTNCLKAKTFLDKANKFSFRELAFSEKTGFGRRDRPQRQDAEYLENVRTGKGFSKKAQIIEIGNVGGDTE